MNNSIAIIRNCQRNCLRKMASNQPFPNVDFIPRATKLQAILQNDPVLTDDFSKFLESDDARKILRDAYSNMHRAGMVANLGDEATNDATNMRTLLAATKAEKIRAYAPWALGSALVGGGLGGWIGGKYNHTLLGALLGGAGGFALGGIGKGLYEKYVKGDRYNKAIGGAAALNSAAQTQWEKEFNGSAK